MALYRLQTTIRTVDNNAANFATNTTYFFDDNLTNFPGLFTAMTAAYNSWRPQMSSLVAQNLHLFKVYNMADPEPRAPLIEQTFNLTTAPAGTPLPPEVALCCSFQGIKISGIPQARRRGRNYLPFPNTAASGTDGRPTAACIVQAVGWGDNILEHTKLPNTPNWVVYSPLLEGNASLVDNGWVDNEWDTQRRRGRPSTSRSIFS